MDSKKDTTQPSGGTNAIQNVDPISLFSKDKNFVFIFKKTERLLAAVYMVTNFFSEREPLKWSLRDMVVKLLSCSGMLKDKLSSQREGLVHDINSIVLEIVSMIEVARYAGLISEMNYEILKREFGVLIQSLVEKEGERSVDHGVSLTQGFFDTKEEQSFSNFDQPRAVINQPISHQETSVTQPEVAGKEVGGFIKRVDLHEGISRSVEHGHGSVTGHIVQHESAPEPVEKRKNGVVEVKKMSRKNIILNLVKEKKEITIKDVSGEIKGCSEKTVQRELLALVKEGILKKEGERRWSKYSLS